MCVRSTAVPFHHGCPPVWGRHMMRGEQARVKHRHTPPLWERACSRFGRYGQSGTPRRGHRGEARLPQALRRPCGSGLARDSGDMVSQAHRGAAIAGKPGSHRHCADLVGAGLLAIRAMRSARHTAAQPSRASPAPTSIAPTLWERACSRFGRYGQPGTPRRSHRGQARLPQALRRPCGSGLARDSGDMVSQAHRGVAIAGKPGSHLYRARLAGDRGCHHIWISVYSYFHIYKASHHAQSRRPVQMPVR